MKVLYELISTQPISGSKFHGGGEAASTVFQEVVKYRKKDDEIICIFESGKYRDERLANFCAENDIKIFEVGSKEEITGILHDHSVDVYVVNLYLPILDCETPTDTKIIFFALDLRMLEISYDSTLLKYNASGIRYIKNLLEVIFPFAHRRFLENKVNNTIGNMIRRSTMVPTVSFYSRYALMNHLGITDKKKVRVLYPPGKMRNKEKIQSPPNISGKYFLLIGINRYEKNAYRVLKAFSEIFDVYGEMNYKVVCVGGDGRSFVNVLKKHAEKFIFEDYLEDDELQNLYQYAHAFIFASLAEGFGLPPIEAMRYGTPVIASAVTSVSEICGGAALYVNPYSIDEIKNRILYAMHEDLSEFRERGKKRYQEMQEMQEKDLHFLAKSILQGRWVYEDSDGAS